MRALIIGGASCGKSEYAEALAMQRPGKRYYVASLMPLDEGSLQCIARHQNMRAQKGFITLERYTDLAGLRLPTRGTVLLECLGNLVANELFAPDGAGAGGAADAIVSGITALGRQCDDLIVVTNDVFADDCDYDDDMLRYMHTLARLNRALARRFDRVVEVVCGIPLMLKGEKP